MKEISNVSTSSIRCNRNDRGSISNDCSGLPNRNPGDTRADEEEVVMIYLLDSKGREVGLEVGGKYDDDIQILEASYEDGTDIGEEEIAYIERTYASELYEEWFEHKLAHADAMLDRFRDEGGY